jgi:hypothetical protein
MLRTRHPEAAPSLPPMPPPVPQMLRISTDGTVIDFPAPVLRPDARCWAATCWPDPAQPGGWGRAVWWPPVAGRPGYQPVALNFSDIVEFGADLPVRSGRKTTVLPVRWYGIMLSQSRYELIVHGPHPTPDTAQRVAHDLRSSLAYRLIGQIELAPPRSTRPAPRPTLHFQTPAYEPAYGATP